MRRLTLLLAILAIFSTAARVPAKDSAAIVGVWRATTDGLPFITLNVTDEAGRLSGAILFYLIRRDEGKPPTSAPGIPEPLFNMKSDQKDLTFQVSHRRAHRDTSSLPPVRFRLSLTGPNEAVLIRAAGSGDESDRVVMVRQQPTRESK